MIFISEAIIMDMLVHHCAKDMLPAITFKGMGNVRRTMAEFDDFLEAFQAEVLKHSPYEVFLKLIDVMEADNGCTFTFTRYQQQLAVPLIQTLQNIGFFTESNHLDLSSSYWMAGASESTEAPEYFGKAGEEALIAFQALNVILDEIFDMPLAEYSEKPTGGQRLADLKRLDLLEELVTEAYVSSCFELDGGVHLTIERPSSEPEAYRHCNTLRQAIDLAIRRKENDNVPTSQS